MQTKTKVVIIGAGPTGLSLAAQLLRYGIDFIILEKNGDTTRFSKAVVVQARTLEILQEMGLAEEALKEGRQTTALNIYHNGKQKANVDLAGLGKGISHYSFALSLEQSKTEKLFNGYLEQRGVSVRWRSEFIRLEQNESNVTAHYKDQEGNKQIIEADYLVGCDGAGSAVRHQLGLSLEGNTDPKIFYVADVSLVSPVINKDQLYLFLIENGIILFFPLEGSEHYRIVGILPDQTEVDENTSFKEVESSLKLQMVSPVDFTKVNWFSTYKVHSRKAGSFISGRCFIAGDAAHIHTPAGGQGMNTGIQDGYNLAWKIAFTLKYKSSPKLLESYSTERTENATHLLRTTDRLFDAMVGSNLFWNFMRLRIFPSVIKWVSKNPLLNRFIFPLISQTGISYPLTALTITSTIGKIKAGDRMPYYITKEGTDIFDLLATPGFKILFFRRDGQNDFEKLKSIKFPLTTFSFNEIPKKYFGSESEFYILLRPDNHISYIGKNLGRCVGFLNNLLVPENRD